MREEYSNQYRRWYDKDPILQRSMETLEQSDDESQIKIALNCHCALSPNLTPSPSPLRKGRGAENCTELHKLLSGQKPARR